MKAAKEKSYIKAIKELRKWFRIELKAIIELFFARECAVCNRELHLYEKHLCLYCYAELPLTYFWNFKDHAAEQIFWGRVEVKRVYSLFYYINRYRAPIHKLKYKSNIQIGLYLGKMLGEKIAKENSEFNYIIPIPLHWMKLQKRGYNQANIIAKGVKLALDDNYQSKESEHKESKHKESEHKESEHKEKVVLKGRKKINKILNNLIVRKEFTKTQTQKDRIDRWKNVSAAFAINERVAKRIEQEREGIEQEKVDKEHTYKILLIDDVLTTGATLEVCAGLIKSYIKADIYIATLAYVE